MSTAALNLTVHTYARAHAGRTDPDRSALRPELFREVLLSDSVRPLLLRAIKHQSGRGRRLRANEHAVRLLRVRLPHDVARYLPDTGDARADAEQLRDALEASARLLITSQEV